MIMKDSRSIYNVLIHNRVKNRIRHFREFNDFPSEYSEKLHFLNTIDNK